MRLLASVPEQAQTVAADIETMGAWPSVLRWCNHAKVLPALAARLPLCGGKLPVAQATELQRGLALQFIATTRCLHEGLQALNLLTSSGIPGVGFKGCAVIAQLYRGPQDRMLQDVDILINLVDLPAALACLKSQGYRSDIATSSIDEYIAFVRNSPGAAGNQAVSLVSEAGYAIDLHWKLGSFDSAVVMKTARKIRVLNTEALMVRPALGLLLTVHHAMRNDFVPSEIARDVLDCARWFALMAGDVDEMKVAVDEARRSGLESALGAMSRIVGAFGGADPFRQLGTRRTSDDLAALYFHQLDGGAVSTDLGYLLSPFAFKQVFMGMSSGWRRYVDFMKKFESANGEESLSLPRRIGRLAASAVKTAPAQWRQVWSLAAEKNRLR